MDKLLVENFYYLMKLGREFEIAAKEAYMEGKIAGFLHLDIGQEAISAGSMRAFAKGDVFTTYREHVLAIARGIPAKSVMAELFGKATGVSGGKGGSMHLFEPQLDFYGGDAIVGGQLPLAVGCAYARKMQREHSGVMVLFGDGATNGGAFFESINIASAWKLPLIFLCENNRYAIGTDIAWVSPFTQLHKKAKGYMPAVEVDGMDVLAVYEAVKEAKEYIEEGLGPYFIEAHTYRYEGHSMSDSGDYRSPEELSIYKAKDPVENLKNKALEKGIVDQGFFDTIDLKVKEEVQEALSYAESSPEPDPSELKTDVFCKECTYVIS